MSIRNESYCLFNRRINITTFRSYCLLAFAAASVLVACGWVGANLHAATQTWAPGGVDGSGNWDTSTNNWNPGPTTWVNNNVAVFGLGGSTSETVTIDTTGITASGLTFNAMSSGAYYTIAGTSTDNLTLSNGGSGGTVKIIMNADATLSTPWTTDSNLLITGNKTLTLAPASSITFNNSPTVTIGDGGVSGVPTLAAFASGGSGGGHGSIVLDGGTFLANHVGQLTSLGGLGVINTFDANGNTSSFVDNTLTQSGAATFVMQNGTISLTGDKSTSFTNGTLQFGNGAATTNILFGYQVSSANNNNLPASGVTIAMDDATLTQASANFSNSGVSVQVDTAANTISNAITLSGANTINTGTLFNLTLAGNITGGGSLIVNGDGVSTRNVILTGTNTYSGGTTISTGQLLQIGSGGTTGSITGNVINNGGYLAFSRSDNITFSGVISGANGGLDQVGIGTLTLTGANTYTGNTYDYGNTIAIGAGGSIVDSAQVLLEGTSSVFDISAGGNQSVQELAGGAGTTVNLGGNTLTEGAAGGSSTFAGGITGTGGGIVKTGSGTLTLLGPATYTGPTSIQSGALTVGIGGSINGTSALIIAAGAKLNLTNTAAGNSVVIDYGTNPSPNSTIQSDLANGAITAPTGYAVGYADGADGVVSGLSAGQEKLMVTLPGDATLSGRVGLAAYGIILSNFGMQSGAQWDQGDFTYNGKVNLADYGDVLANFGQSLSAPLVRTMPAADVPAQGDHVVIPEPATLVLLTLGGMGLIIRRKYRNYA